MDLTTRPDDIVIGSDGITTTNFYDEEGLTERFLEVSSSWPEPPRRSLLSSPYGTRVPPTASCLQPPPTDWDTTCRTHLTVTAA